MYDTCCFIHDEFLTKKNSTLHSSHCYCAQGQMFMHVPRTNYLLSGEMVFVLTCMITRKMTLYLRQIFYVLTLLLFCFDCATCLGDVIYAINAGGEAHTDSHGVRYERDPLQGKVGIASSYGKRLLIGRVPPNDQILYQTERYHHSTFGYDIPISEDGDYIMILKFCEVYFNAPNMKVSSRYLRSSQRCW